MKLKIIKSLLIPTLSITLSATTISSLTSCTNNSEIKKYYLIGGSTQLSGIEGKAGSDTKSWQLSLDGKTITDNIDWGIEDNNGAAINGISINGGIVSWVANMNTREYYFYVIVTYDRLKVKSPQIKLTISQYILDGGNTELNGAYGHAGRDNNSWKLSLDGKQITQGITWKIEDNNDGAINSIFVNDGIVSWIANMNTGEYYFYVIATHDGLTIKSAQIKLTINQYILDGGSVQLNGAYGNAGRDNNSWKLSLDGQQITNNIDWTTYFIGIAQDGISINEGVVSWSDNIAIGEYDFLVIATYNGVVMTSPLIKLTIN